MWIARDLNNELFLYTSKPIKEYEQWELDYKDGHEYSIYLNDNDNNFPNVKWENDEPTKIKLMEM